MTNRIDHRTWSAALIAATIFITVGCGSSAPEKDPATAASALQQNLELTDDQTTCMRLEFEATPAAAGALDTAEVPTDQERELFLVALRRCLPPEEFGASLAATVREELPETSETQAQCVQDNVVALDASEQDRLYLYFANPAALDVADVGPAGTDLLASCNLLPAPSTSVEPTDPTDPAG